MEAPYSPDSCWEFEEPRYYVAGHEVSRGRDNHNRMTSDHGVWVVVSAVTLDELRAAAAQAVINRRVKYDELEDRAAREKASGTPDHLAGAQRDLWEYGPPSIDWDVGIFYGFFEPREHGEHYGTDSPVWREYIASKQVRHRWIAADVAQKKRVSEQAAAAAREERERQEFERLKLKYEG